MSNPLRKKRLDIFEVQSATQRGKEYAESTRRKLEAYDTDEDQVRRLKVRACKYCYYMRGSIAGQAFTPYSCAACGTVKHHENTAVPLLCIECSNKLSLCCRCGGDMLGKNRRTLDLSDIPWTDPTDPK